MFGIDPTSLWLALAVMMLIATISWVVSLLLNDVSIVDSAWSLFFLAAGVSVISVYDLTPLKLMLLLLLVFWAIRLSAHLTYRNWGEPEDHRYQTIRANNQPHFEYKSLFIIFYLQAILAWIISLPVLAILSSQGEVSFLAVSGLVIAFFGIVFESIADYQLLHFQTHSNDGEVLQTGLWRYSRHPNYFGEVCVWWGFYLTAASLGFAWTIIAPLLITFLILKISGVALTEKTITSRRPEYQQYIDRTSAFIPLPPRRSA